MGGFRQPASGGARDCGHPLPVTDGGHQHSQRAVTLRASEGVPRAWLVAALLFVWPASALPAEACEPGAEVAEIAAGIYVRPGRHAVVFDGEAVANIGFVVGDRCVAVIDTGGSYSEGQALRCAIERATTRPVCFVINTHVHPDHWLGNLAFAKPGVFYVGHTKLPRALALRGTSYLERAGQQAGRPLGPEHIKLPDLAVDGRLSLDLGDRVLEIVAHPVAHTDSDLSVYDEKTGTLWLSDLVFIEHIPVIDGSLLGWLNVLEALLEQPAQRVVPGHGPAQAAWPAAAGDTRRYLSALRDETRERIAKGNDIQEAQHTVAYGERTRWQLFEDYHRRNIIAAYRELEWED
jgi:quinoprotein relay system zinc metallohydrolase 2